MTRASLPIYSRFTARRLFLQMTRLRFWKMWKSVITMTIPEQPSDWGLPSSAELAAMAQSYFPEFRDYQFE